MVEKVVTYSSRDLADHGALMHELSATSSFSKEFLKKAQNDTNVYVYVIKNEGNIVDTGKLCIKHTLEFAIADDIRWLQ